MKSRKAENKKSSLVNKVKGETKCKHCNCEAIVRGYCGRDYTYLLMMQKKTMIDNIIDQDIIALGILKRRDERMAESARDIE